MARAAQATSPQVELAMEELVGRTEALLTQGQLLEAVELYLQAAEREYHTHLECSRRSPAVISSRKKFADSFVTVLGIFLDGLDCGGDPNAMQQFSLLIGKILSISALRNDEVVLTMLGVKCLDDSNYPQAQLLLQMALDVDPDCLSAKENLHTMFDRIVNRWHFLMLNDIARNEAYSQAIQRAVISIPDCKVLDVGSGTGILSMMAVKLGAKQVYACELDVTMVTMSHDILLANGMEDDITLLHSLSTKLSVPKDIPEKVSLVVTEIVDAGLLGECIVPTLRHAWKELLLPSQPAQLNNQVQHRSGGHVIPCGATVYAVAIECLEIRRQSKFLTRDMGGLTLGGLILEGSCKTAQGGYRLGATKPLSDVEEQLVREPYTCERLTQIRGGYRALTGSCVALQFDFCNPEIPLPENYLQLQVMSGGIVDAIATWFDLHLDSHTSISTAPSWDLSWEQAVFPVQGDLVVDSGCSILLHASCSETLLSMSVEGIRKDMPNLKMAGVTFESDVEAAVSLNAKQHEEPGVFFVERGDLSRLNDSYYIETYRRAISQSIAAVSSDLNSNSSCGEPDLELDVNLSQMKLNGGDQNGGNQPLQVHLGMTTVARSCSPTPEEVSMDSDSEGSSHSGDYADCIVLDMAHGMFILGLLAAKEGADFVQVGRSHSTYKALTEHLARCNGTADKVSFRYLQLDQRPMPQFMWDMVVMDVVSPQGVLLSGCLEELAFLRSRYFHSESVIIPCTMVVHAVCISSPALRAQASVLGTIPTLGFDIARFINQYQVSHFIDVDLSVFPHKAMSDICQLLTVDLNTLGAETLRVERTLQVAATSSGTVTGVAYWFTLGLYGNVTMTTGPAAYQGSHWHQAVFILPEDMDVQIGQQLSVRGLIRDSCLNITISNA